MRIADRRFSIANRQNLDGQFSCVLTVAFATNIGLGLSANALAMPAPSANYSSDFLLVNVPARSATTRTVTFSPADRARPQRVDADFLAGFPDTNGHGLPGWWQTDYFAAWATNRVPINAVVIGARCRRRRFPLGSLGGLE